MTPSTTSTAAIYIPFTNRHPEQQLLQTTQLREYAGRMGWQVIEYCERHSKMLNRPVFRELMADSWRSKKFSVVLVQDLSCFASSLPELLENVSTLRERNIRFLTADQKIDTDFETRAGRTTLHVLSVLTGADRAMKVENIRAGISAAKRKGVHCGRPPAKFPRGRMRELRKEGLSIRAIAARIGVPASTVADALKAGPGGI